MKQKKVNHSSKELISKLRSILGTEIEELPDTLSQVTPEKRLDFISKTLPILVKYEDSNSLDWDNWGIED